MELALPDGVVWDYLFPDNPIFYSIGNEVSYRIKTLRGDAQLRARNKSCAIHNIGSRSAQSALLFLYMAWV